MIICKISLSIIKCIITYNCECHDAVTDGNGWTDRQPKLFYKEFLDGTLIKGWKIMNRNASLLLFMQFAELSRLDSLSDYHVICRFTVLCSLRIASHFLLSIRDLSCWSLVYTGLVLLNMQLLSNCCVH